jgi:hypothetical protein
MKPKQMLTEQQLDKLQQYLNSTEFLQRFVCNGNYKIGQKALYNAFIPKNLVCDAE